MDITERREMMKWVQGRLDSMQMPAVKMSEREKLDLLNSLCREWQSDRKREIEMQNTNK